MLKIKELETKINEASSAYYNSNAIISDDEFDALIYELETLDPTNKILETVGAEPTSSEWKKEKHLFHLGSLEKMNSPEAMSKWIEEKLFNKPVIVVEKLDGLSIGVRYDDGKLTQGLLRGAGKSGENIYQNVLKIQGVPKNVPGFSGVLRGEIILTKSNHIKYFPSYSNPRNAASGLCRSLDGNSCEHLDILFYQVFGKEFKTEEDQFQFLKDIGCSVPGYHVCNTSDQVNGIWKNYQDKIRETLDYDIDGLVINCNDLPFQNSLGNSTSMRPRGKKAFKFANQFIKTTIKGIEFVCGNSGRITPVCWFEPVKLLGSTIEKASVYNVAYIEKLGLGPGAEVLVCKAGEIIPRVEKVIKAGEKTIIIKNCPSCNAPLINEGEYLVCPNTDNCSAQKIGALATWIKNNKILEWGDGLLEKLVWSKKVSNIVDLYKLSIDDLASLERMGTKSATNCYNSLWSHKIIPLDTFLGSLNIPMIGTSSIKMVMDAGFDSLGKILDATQENFNNVKGLGPVKSQSLFQGLKINKHIIEGVIMSGIKIEENKKVEPNLDCKLIGKSFQFTGAMVNKRSILEELVIGNGGTIKNVSKNLNYLVIADPDSQSSKAVKARALGITLLSEQDFINMVAIPAVLQ